MTSGARLTLPNPCPLGGVWLPEDQFYYQPPGIFAHLRDCRERGGGPLPQRDLSQFFADSSPISLELCSGNGLWVARQAERDPKRNWIAVERRFDRARQIWRRRSRADLANLAIACSEAGLFCARAIPSEIVDTCYINFPDPWPKQRHAKHRLMQPNFLGHLERLLSPEGQLFVVSDVHPLLRELELNLRARERWSVALRSMSETELLEYGDSFFANLWRTKGRELYLVHARPRKWNRSSVAGG